MTRPIDRKRWRHAITEYLRDLPRQIGALDHSMEPFPDAESFRSAFESDDLNAYGRAQQVERAFGRVQNYLAQLAEDGTKLADLDRRLVSGKEPRSAPYFEALRDASVIEAELCRRLISSQADRNLVEHDYVKLDADRLYAAVERLRDVAPAFARRYRDWIASYIAPTAS